MDGENVQVFKDLKVTMDKYVFHSNFLSLDMDYVDVAILRWIQLAYLILMCKRKFFEVVVQEKESHIT